MALKKRKRRIPFSTYLHPDNPVHAAMIDYLDEMTKKRLTQSIIRQALIAYVSKIIAPANPQA